MPLHTVTHDRNRKAVVRTNTTNYSSQNLFTEIVRETSLSFQAGNDAQLTNNDILPRHRRVPRNVNKRLRRVF